MDGFQCLEEHLLFRFEWKTKIEHLKQTRLLYFPHGTSGDVNPGDDTLGASIFSIETQNRSFPQGQRSGEVSTPLNLPRLMVLLMSSQRYFTARKCLVVQSTPRVEVGFEGPFNF